MSTGLSAAAPGPRREVWRSLEFRLLLLGATLCLLPFVAPGRYEMQFADLILVYIVIAIGQNIVLGYSGQISVAQSALAAISAYTSALLCIRLDCPFWLAAIAAVLLSTVCAALLGLLTSRVRTHYLLLVTIGFHIIVLMLIINLVSLTGGPMGLYPVPKINLGGLVLLSPSRYYYLYLPVAVLLLYLAERIRTSRVGLAIFALRSNETAALTVGVAPRYYFALAMALSGFYAGIGGVMFAFLVGFLGPESFALQSALFYIVIVVLGGMGNNYGVILVTVGLNLLSENLKVLAGSWVMIYGILIMATIGLAPGGLPELGGKLTQRLGLRRSADAGKTAVEA
jgi:branched-chain amino acid transport system permease protein